MAAITRGLRRPVQHGDYGEGLLVRRIGDHVLADGLKAQRIRG